MALLRRIVMLGRRSRMEREIQAELQEHLQMCIDDNVAEGMSREQAVREARLRFGSPTATRERVWAEDAALGLENLVRDLRMALRGFVKSPGFTVVVVATLALGIGANTAIFELLDAVRLRSLPVTKPGELAEVRIAGGNGGFGINNGLTGNFTIPMWLEVKGHHDPFSGIFAWRPDEVLLGNVSDSRRANGLEVSGNFFNVLGVAPRQGRLIEPQDEVGCDLTKVVALGASRGRLLRQMVIESVLLAVIGAALGVALAQPLSRALVNTLNTSQGTIHLTIAPDWRVLLFAAMVSVATCVVFGTLPAVRNANTEPITSMKSGERGLVGNRERFTVQRAMVITQVAVSMVLLVGALLFVRSYRNLMSVDPGIRESGMTVGYFGFQAAKIKPENLGAYKRQLVDDVRALPGIENVTGTTNVPLSGSSWSHHVQVDALDGSSKFTYVSPSYFATLGIPLLTGRNFNDRDTNDAPLVLIVNQTFIRKYIRTPSPIGQHVHVRPEPQYPERTYEIIGTIPDTKYGDLRDETPPMAFVPIDQFPVTAQGPGMAMMFASRDAASAVETVRHMFEQKHPGTVLQFFDLEQGIRDNLVGDRMMAMLSGFFGVLASLLVVVGLYGVLSYFLAQRRGEIGIRIALGASRGRVIGALLRDAVVMLLVGLVAGTGLALLAGREASSMLFGLKPWDPITLSISALLLGIVTLLTSIIPALKAAHVSPIDSLRTE